YHTLTHLTAVLDHIDVLEADQAGAPAPASDPDLTPDLALVRLAAWFHDAVYAPDRSENEERSARLAERALTEAGVSPAGTAEVARLVRLTLTHDPAPDDRNGQVLCDADLAILAAAPDTYAAYTAAVREEYAFVPDDAFRAGRAAVLRQLLALPQLFRTPYGTEQWEEPARANIVAELRWLEGDSGPI
ncbi:HD domain-containing protein, partial [Streptomyces reticuliscabiei]